MTKAAQREQVHRLVDVSPEQLAALRVLLEVMVDPSTRKLATAPLEDELVGQDENAQAASVSGPMYPIEEVMAELGITPADLEHQRKQDEIAGRSR